MRSVTLMIFLVTASVTLTNADNEESERPIRDFDMPLKPVKLDKNLRRALLKALADLEEESAEQHRREEEEVNGDEIIVGHPPRNDDTVQIFGMKNPNKNLAVAQKESYTFDGFPGDEETPNEDKLQNSSFVETRKYNPSEPTANGMSIEKASNEDARAFHVHKVILSDENENNKNLVRIDQVTNSQNKIEPVTYRPLTTQIVQETLKGSASSGIAMANSLIPPKPTVSSPTVAPPSTISPSNISIVASATSSPVSSKEKSEEVKIFPAPLVAAFTVQQDERGVPKSVVPIFRSTSDGGQALTLQEQLEFKQKLLEKQLAELQQQQIQQTQLLVQQQQLYEQQLRQKQQQQLYLQEQARLKQLNEQQARLKQLEQQRLYQYQQQQLALQQQQKQSQFLQQSLKPIPQQQSFLEQNNNLLSLKPPLETPNVHFQPSLALEVPNSAAPPPFQINFQDQLRAQQLRQQQQQQQQQQRLQQQKLQQSFPSAPFSTEFQPPLQVASSNRFNRQEAFNAVGNFGFNFDNKSQATRNSFGVTLPPRNNVPAAQNFIYNPYVQFRAPQAPAKPPTPAKQIQHLLYQSGIAGDLGTVQGSSGPEDLNIVSKVLALNVGAVPLNNLQYTSNRGNQNLFGKTIGIV